MFLAPKNFCIDRAVCASQDTYLVHIHHSSEFFLKIPCYVLHETSNLTVKSKGKGKVLPRTGHEGPEGE
jgi:hypothetical protein